MVKSEINALTAKKDIRLGLRVLYELKSIRMDDI